MLVLTETPGIILHLSSWQTFLVKGQIINVLDFVKQKLSFTTTQHCCHQAEAARDNM
jgi:hypothetical protein